MLRKSLSIIGSDIYSRNFFRTIWLGSSHLRENKEDISGSVATKFKTFSNSNSGVIYDVEEERLHVGNLDSEIQGIKSLRYDISTERGITGVFEIQELVKLLEKENAKDLCVIKVPKELKYVDYMVIMNGSSYRHMIGVAQYVRKCFKIKRHMSDPIPKIEGAGSKEWIAMDLGNIALHIFTPKARNLYNLESLWLLGEEYEKKISSLRNKKHNELEEMYQNFNEMLNVNSEEKISQN